MTAMPLNRSGRTLALVLVIQVLALSCALAQVSGVTQAKLDNGLTVLMKEVHAAPVFTAQVWFKVGSRNEHVGITGISHMLEHMLFNSSKHYKKGEITRLIDERGGIDNAATWTDFTYYWELLSSDHLEFAMKTLADRMGGALLLPEEFAKERTVVLSELQGKENNPNTLLYKAVVAAAFTAHPYHSPVIGWQSDVEHIDRNQLWNYYQSYYHPNNATLVLVGDFDPAKAMSLVKKYFGPMPKRELPRPVYTTEPEQRGDRRVTIRREGSAERVMLAYHIPGVDNPDTYPLMVLDQILSGGRSSRLYQALVENQLATSAWSSADIRRDPALFFVGATARQGVTADQLEKSLAEQVEKAKTTLPTAEEIQAAKNQLEAYFVYQNDSVSDQGEQLGYYNTVTTWQYLNTLIPRIKAVTAEQVKATAAKYLVRDNMTLGKFIPTGPATSGEGAPESGPLQYREQARPGEDRVTGHRAQGAGYSRSVSQAKTAGAGSRPAPAQPSAPKQRRLVEPHRVALDNGMVVIVHENHSNPTIAIAGSTKAGGYFDPAGKDGVAAMTAEMIGRGTQKRTALQLACEAEYVGASLDASAETESMRFGARSLAKDFPLMLDLLADELRNASFPEDQFEKAKGEMVSALEQSKESPRARAFRAFYNIAFPEGHPYWQPTVDEAQKALQSITREDLVGFYQHYYRPDTTIITIVGDVDTAKAVELVKRYFGDWKAEGPKPEMNILTILPSDKPSKVVIPMMDKSEVSIVIGYPLGIRRSNPDFYAMRIANQILGGAGALGSLLGEEIREKQGLVYNVYSTFDAGLGAGPWYASLGTNPKNAEKAVQTLTSLVERFKKNGATKEQFQRAKEFIVGVFPIALETNAGVARAVLSAEFYGLGMDYLENYANIYRSVTLEQVNAAARKYLHPDTAALVIAGPYTGD